MKSFRSYNKFGVVKIRKMSYSKTWNKTATEVKKRDGNVCAICGGTDGLETHHIIPISKGGTNKKTNLITLCEKHHNQRHRHRRKSKRVKTRGKNENTNPTAKRQVKKSTSRPTYFSRTRF